MAAVCHAPAMRIHRPRTARLLLAAALTLGITAVGCSDDDGETASSTTAATGSGPNGGEVSAEYQALCDAARATLNATPSQAVENAQAALDAAPDELKEDLQVMLDLVTFATENPSDAAGIAERTEAAAAPMQRYAETIQAECGFNVLK